MEYRRLGRAGINVSALSYGAWVSFDYQLGVDQAKKILEAARSCGVNFFDNAEVYAKGQAEVIMGKAIKDLGWKRSDVVLSTKIFWGPGDGPNDKGLSRKHIIEGTKASLQRLDTDYVDLLFCHRPDPDTPIEETVRAMNWVLDQGMAFYWGTSEWSTQQILEAWEVADRLDLIGPTMEQPEYNLFNRQKVEVDFLPLYDQRGMGTTIWSPLAGGILTGKYSGGKIPEGSRLTVENYQWMKEQVLTKRRHHIEIADKLIPVASELGCSLAQLALAWTLKNPHVSTAITGSTKVEQVLENMKAIEVVPKLTPEVMAKIEEIAGTKPTPA